MNLVEGLHEQMNRCRCLVKDYEALGPAGSFGKTVIQNSIKNGETAIASGDVIKMLATYEDLKERK